MSGSPLGIVVEILVALLLVIAIGYCVLVNRKLEGLRSDKSELRSIIRDLYAATGHAEQAIGTLRETAKTLDESLGEQVARAQKIEKRLITGVERGEGLLSKLSAISPAGAAPVRASRPPRAPQASAEDALVLGTAPDSRGKSRLRHSELGLGLLNAQKRAAISGHDGGKEVA